jgi:2-amino-4-hydroxy-6-hydroxymethyldihydropteridine diphosphokinase
VAEVLIGLGANIGDREARLREAVQQLARAGAITAISSLYQTEPVGYREQDDFLNACLLLRTDWSRPRLLRQAHAIEEALGRVRTIPDGPRSIDIDLLLWRDGVTLHAAAGPEPLLPHPRMHLRRFVLAPLAEIAPDWEHPRLGRTVGELLADLPPGEAVERISSPTWPPSLKP